MNSNLAPAYQISIGDCWVLWFKKSNSYSIIDNEFKNLLDLFINSKSENQFKSKILQDDSLADSEELFQTILKYLANCNLPITTVENEIASLDTSRRNISKYYNINGKTLKVNYDCELVLKTVHPSIAHCLTSNITAIDVTFDIYLKANKLYLFKDEKLIISAPKLDYHKIQGKFIMQLLCTIHNQPESEWIGTFHGSTITNEKSSILIIGESGKGKSTLCAVLTASGFKLLADDVSPMLSKTEDIYFNPGAISIKEGAFKTLDTIIPNFNALPNIVFNKSKGVLKYVPCTTPEKLHYPCDAVVLVNYSTDSKTSLQKVSIKKMLETLIPDSWLSPNPHHAQQFLNWLQRISIYELTYSNNSEATNEISKLFNAANN
ncbi:hypothetical protein [Winogradskyella endarachnes]|uniref:Serine kinase n=1 Tax=Winogradskyella endarachnes TaxID=2681965 RepID=A0A6L6UAR8_9FLAO|nr:hypothetical protein [Winogradskyella endarachnes]MUU77854.1 hypothetical protein [Winogradskyella endarachnes]